MTTVYAWVIETKLAAGLLYWDGGDWTRSNARAVRFSRKVDAERVMINLGDNQRRTGMAPVEHGWMRQIIARTRMLKKDCAA